MWRAYGRLLSTYPVRTQMATTAVIWCAGDIAAQRLERARKPPSSSGGRGVRAAVAPPAQDWGRTRLQTVYSALVWAPMAHYWYEALDRLVLRVAKAGTRRFVGAKLALEMAALHPVSLLAFFVCVGVGGGDSASEVRAQLRRDFLPSLGLEWLMW